MNSLSSDARVVQVAAGAVMLTGELRVPLDTRGIVLLTHGSGGNRYSRRDRSIAQVLQEGKFATLMIDLLTPQEDAMNAQLPSSRVHIPLVPLLAERLLWITVWLTRAPETAQLPIGYLGACIGAAAALLAAAAQPGAVGAIVSCMGRPDLARTALPHVRTPTLLIAGEFDFSLIEVNEDAYAKIRGPSRIEFIPGATQLFGEPGSLQQMGQLARDWFTRYLGLIA